jgi:cytochrome d ubiquinol oxidase subunit II
VDIEVLRVIWLVLIGILWTGYLVLEGFDFGVGMLLPILGRTDTDRRLMINTIGPLWDGNEVWVLTAGGATFAAFPLWYSTLFSAFYLPLLLILVGLILRGVAFEYRGKIADSKWAAGWDWAIIVGSYLPALLWGVAFGNLVHGATLENYKAGPFAILLHALNAYSLVTGITVVLLFMLHGALFLSLKTSGDMRERSLKMAGTLSIPTTVVAAVWAIWTQVGYSNKIWTWAIVAVAAIALVATILATRQGREGLGFTLTSLVSAGAVLMIFATNFPKVLPLTAGGQDISLTITNASSTALTLTTMTWVAVIFVPIVLAYQAWSIWVFRRRLSTTNIPLPAGLTSLKAF